MCDCKEGIKKWTCDGNLSIVYKSPLEGRVGYMAGNNPLPIRGAANRTQKAI